MAGDGRLGEKDVCVQLSEWRHTMARECTNVTGERSGGLWVASVVYSPISGLSGVDVLYMSHRVDAGMQRRALHRRQSVHARVMTHVAAVRHHHSRMRMSR